MVGPLAPHWARRAGTPTSVLNKAHPVAAVITTRGAPTTSPARSSTSAKDTIPHRFDAQLSGTLSQTQQPDGALVDLVLHCSGPISGEMRVRMAGSPVPGGGLSMTGSQVQLTAVGLALGADRSISTLEGAQFDARVRNRTGTSLVLHVDLNIDNTTNTVTGTLDASPS